MSAPNQRQPARNDEALDILRRLEPTLARMTTDLAKVAADVAELKAEQKDIKAEQHAQAVALAEIKGQLKAVPSIWQIVTVVGMVNGIALALATYLRH